MLGNYFYLKYYKEQFDSQLFLVNEFIKGYSAAYKFYIFHGHLNVPLEYQIKNFKLGHFLKMLRVIKDELTVNQIKMLEAIDMNWEENYDLPSSSRSDKIWDKKYELAELFYQEHHHLKVPSDYHIGTVNLGSWISKQRKNEKKEKLTCDKMMKLDELDMIYSFNYLDEVIRISSTIATSIIPSEYLCISPFSSKENPLIVKPKTNYPNIHKNFFQVHEIFIPTTDGQEVYNNLLAIKELIIKQSLIAEIKKAIFDNPNDFNKNYETYLNDLSSLELISLKEELGLEDKNADKQLTKHFK